MRFVTPFFVKNMMKSSSRRPLPAEHRGDLLLRLERQDVTMFVPRALRPASGIW